METVQDPKAQNCISGNPPTLGEPLEPPEEKEIRLGPSLEPERSDEAIVDIVHLRRQELLHSQQARLDRYFKK